MTRRGIFQTLAATAVVGVVSIGMIAPALAQDETADDTTVTDVREARQSEFAAALAEELGLDEETVATAIDTVRDDLRAAHHAERLAELEERLAEAVEAGRITQEQADALIAAHEAGEFVGRGPGGRGHGGFGGLGPGPGAGGGFGYGFGA